MALRNSKLFLVFAWTIATLAIASFVLRVVLAVFAGNGLLGYTSGTGVPWHYSSAFVVIVIVVVILVVAALQWIWRRYRKHNGAARQP
jgi:membrane protein YdbS with pleckstrin-like domain